MKSSLSDPMGRIAAAGISRVAKDGRSPQPWACSHPLKSLLGGFQGLRWYARRFRIDEDGDVANEFLKLITRKPKNTNTSEFLVKYSTKPAAIRNETISTDGNIHQNSVYQGRTPRV